MTDQSNAAGSRPNPAEPPRARTRRGSAWVIVLVAFVAAILPGFAGVGRQAQP